jgi:carbon storage regulator CsrA
MLILSRKLNERVVFPAFRTAIQVIATKGNTVRLGIEAPRDVEVLREELCSADNWRTLEELNSANAGRATTKMAIQRLEIVATGLDIVEGYLRGGKTGDSLNTLEGLREEIALLKGRLAGGEHQRSQDPRCRALLVEDDRNERELLASYLRMAGIQVDTAGDGASALEYLRARSRPDVLLLDMALPCCDGPTALREIRRNPNLAGMPIFAVSGHSPEEFDVPCGPAGVDRWFLKPLDPAILLRDIDAAVGSVGLPR